MRITHLLTLASACGTVASSASAQDPQPPAQSRVRITTRGVFRPDDARQPEHRAALGVGTSTTGTARDTLGLLVTSVMKGSPAEKAGLEEGNRIAAINGVSLRVNAADVEDSEMSGALTRRLTRELGKSKPGDEVELRVYRDGRTQTLKLRSTDSDSLFRRPESVRTTQADRDNRPTLGFGIGSTGSRRDTLGVLVMSVSDSSPASKAGLEEGNRIAAINGVNLRVAHEDAGDRYLGEARAQRLQREVSQLKAGDNVTLKVYSEGKFRDVSMKVARVADVPRSRNGMIFLGGDGAGFGVMPPMPPMARMPASPRMSPAAPMPAMEEEMRVELDAIRPQLERIQPRVQMELDRMRPELDRIRTQLPDIMERARAMPRVRMMNVIV